MYSSAFQRVSHSHPCNPFHAFQFPVRTFLSLRPYHVLVFSYPSLQAGEEFTCQHLSWGASETRDVHWLWQQIQPSFPIWTCHRLLNPHVTVCESKHNLVWLFSAHMWILFPALLPEKKSEIVSSRGLLLTPWLALWLNLTSVEKTYSVLLPSHTAWDFLRVVSPFVSSTNLFYSSSLYTWTIFSKSPELTGCKPDGT